MATRFYLNNGAAPFTPSTIRGAWDATGSSVVQELSLLKGGVAATIGVAETSSVANLDQLLGRWVSNPLDANVSFATTDTVNWVIGALESSTDANMVFQVHRFVLAGVA